MTIREVYWHSRAHIESIPPQQAVISIGGEHSSPANLDGWKEVLRLYFSDYERPVDGELMFENKHAAQIISFLDCCLDSSIDRIDVHCQQGISRSAAVARFLCQRYDIDFDEYEGRGFNRLVYRTLAHYDGLEIKPDVYVDPNDDGSDIVIA